MARDATFGAEGVRRICRTEWSGKAVKVVKCKYAMYVFADDTPLWVDKRDAAELLETVARNGKPMFEVI